ncbi:MAG TPA: hypothetical protein VLK33_00955 [Terriglobales bacterium]|nr:hypothetical protein [Terriglobales bacterium]
MDDEIIPEQSMSINVQWDNEEHTLVRWDFIGMWDWNDFLAAQKTSNDLISSVPHTVDIIGDVSRSPHVPPGAMARFRTYRRNDPENAGRVVLVGANIYIKTIVDIFRGMFPKTGGNFTFANSLEEARSTLTAKH